MAQPIRLTTSQRADHGVHSIHDRREIRGEGIALHVFSLAQHLPCASFIADKELEGAAIPAFHDKLPCSSCGADDRDFNELYRRAHRIQPPVASSRYRAVTLHAHPPRGWIARGHPWRGFP